MTPYTVPACSQAAPSIRIPVKLSLQILHRQVLIESADDSGGQKAQPHCDHPNVGHVLVFGSVKELTGEREGRERGAAKLHIGLGVVAEHA
jgi:hypothetical protein